MPDTMSVGLGTGWNDLRGGGEELVTSGLMVMEEDT